MDLPAWPNRASTPITVGFVLAMAVLGGLTAVYAGGWPVMDVVAAVLGSAAVVGLTRLRPPVWPAVGLAVLAAVSPAATPASTAATLRMARSRPLWPAVGLAGLGAGAHLVRYAWLPVAGLEFVWWAVLVVVAHAALLGWGAYAQSRHALLESLRERARRAEAAQEQRVAQARSAERTRIAREMHDVLAHRLTLVAATAGAMEFRPDTPPERMVAAAGVLRAAAHTALDELREVIGVLRADPGDDRPQPTTADLPRLVDEVRASGVTVDLRDDLDGEVTGSVGRTVYRVVQEGLTNARKHAAGQPIRVRLIDGDELSVEVTNPVGEPAGTPGSGTGLVGLAERVELAGGRLEHGIVDGEFRLAATLVRR